MGYSNFKNLRQALERLGLEEIDVELFPVVNEVPASDWLLKSLENAEIMPMTNEKSKSERVISPILMEVAIHFKTDITLYSGEDLYLDEKKDLSGPCDFFLAKHPRKLVMQAPIITLAEAKDEVLGYGMGQCAAQMYAAQIFNEQKGKPQPFIYGCAVTGGEWKFMKLSEKKLSVDMDTYYISELPKILGVFHHIIKQYL